MAQEVFQPHPKTSLLGGLTTTSGVTRTPTAFSVGFARTEDQWFEGHLGLAYGLGSLTVGAAGQFKSVFKGDPRQGLHWGVSLGLGSERENFFATLAGLVGFHLAVPTLERVFMIFEAGPVLTLGAPSDLSVGPLSGALGLTVFYRI